MFFRSLLRYAGDASAMTSRIALARKIKTTQSLSGLSLKTQILYLVIYVLRYLDLLQPRVSLNKSNIYNTTMKIVYISFQVYLISLFYGKLKHTYSKRYDTFNIPIFLVVSFTLAVFFKDDTSSIFKDFSWYTREYFYACSLILESLAILPQLVVIQDSGECEKLTALFIWALGLYRFIYFLYFMLGVYNGAKPDSLMIITSLCQSVLYLDFFRIYFINKSL